MPSRVETTELTFINDSALCAQTGPNDDVFHPGPGQVPNVELARAICGRCPLQEPCLEYALANPDTRGVWAATTTAERDRIRKRQASSSSTA